MPETLPWWKTAVVYQIYPRSFQDTDGDGVGDLNGIRARLDYLAELGVDALWISPIYPSPMRDFGYDVTDYTGVDPRFGTLEDFTALVDDAHARGIRIVLDFVPNHSSDAHPWFVESRASRDNPKRDWYIWRPPKGDGSPPNNWRGVDGIDTPGSAWRFDEATGEYYYASYSAFQPDLDWANPEVRAAMMRALEVWLERGVDGFRIDMVDFLGKDPDLRDEPPRTAEAEDYLAAAVHQLGRPETLAYVRDIHRTVHAYPERVTIGEVLYFLTPQELDAFYDGGHGLDLPFHFGLMFLPMEAEPLRERIDAYDAGLSPGNWPNYNLANHDMPRLSRHGAKARLAAMLLLTVRGTPFLYYGDEIGMPNVHVPTERQQDPFIIYQTGTTRDGSRTPMRWDAGPNAGFSTVEPWLPVGGDVETINVRAQRGDGASMLEFYRRLLEVRRATPALRQGGYRSLDEAPEDCLVYVRELGDAAVLVALNFGAEARTIGLPDREWTRVAASTRPARDEDPVGRSLVLEGHEGTIVV